MKWKFDRATNMKVLTLIAILALAGLTPSCQRSSDDIWNDTKTAGRHVGRGADTLGGKGGESRQVRSPEEFAADDSDEDDNYPSAEDDFIAFNDEPTANKSRGGISMSGAESVPQPRETPGEAGSSIPGISAFQDPAQDPNLAPIFEHVHFEYNSSMIKNDDSIATLQKIADYLKSHPSIYLFVEGHCDQRGPSAYNFALGANRASSVRAMLIREGISADRIFTISYGKERLLFPEEGEEFYRLNRRAQFKVWQQS